MYTEKDVFKLAADATTLFRQQEPFYNIELENYKQRYVYLAEDAAAQAVLENQMVTTDVNELLSLVQKVGKLTAELIPNYAAIKNSRFELLKEISIVVDRQG